MTEPVESYLPVRYTSQDVKDLHATGGYSMQQCKSILEAKYRLRVKGGLQEAVADYISGGRDEAFLAHIVSEMLELL